MAGLYSAPSLLTYKVDRFKGVDLSVPEDQMKPYRAAMSENMIPGAVGEVQKRPGVQHKGVMTGFDVDKNGLIKGGGYICEMIGGKYPLVRDMGSSLACYKLFYKNGKKVLTSYYKPVSISYGTGWVVFATLRAEELTGWKNIITDWRIGGIEAEFDDDGNQDEHSKKFEFFAAMVVFDIEGAVRVYTNNGYCCVMDAAGNWSSEVISIDDPLLTVPTIYIGCDPAGGGSPFQKANLLSPWVTESFCCKADQTSVFYLNSKVSNDTEETTRWGPEYSSTKFRVKVLCTFEMEISGSNEKTKVARWIERPLKAAENGAQYGSDGYRPAANRIFLEPNLNGNATYRESGVNYPVDLGTGKDNWIGPTPVEGEDNVLITHWRADFNTAFCRLCTCACGTVFGVGGYKDRLFLGGGRAGEGGYKERIYYSELEDPFYIADLNYLKLEDGCQVMALDGTADVLAALTDRGIYMVQAQAQDNTDDIMYVSDALFTVSGKVLAPRPLHYGDTEMLGGEIVYLSEEGIIAVAYRENFDERFAEHRSALIDPQMMKDGPQQLISLGRFLMVRCKEGVWWLLDENQPNAEGDKPYSSHQYEGYRLTGMPADTAWAVDGILHLVKGGVVCTWKDGTEATHYCDNYTNNPSGETAIVAYWETPWIYGHNFHLDKIFMRMGLLLGTGACDSSVLVNRKKNAEDWEVLWDYDGTLCTFDFGNLDFRLFTFSLEPGCPDISGKVKIKKAKRLKLRFSNNFINQTLILRKFCLDYAQEG